jgi:hypothetical protein
MIDPHTGQEIPIEVYRPFDTGPQQQQLRLDLLVAIMSRGIPPREAMSLADDFWAWVRTGLSESPRDTGNTA